MAKKNKSDISSLESQDSKQRHQRKMQNDRHEHQRNMQHDRHHHEELKWNIDEHQKNRDRDAKVGALNSQKRIDDLVAAGVLTYKNGKLCEGKNAGVPHKYDHMGNYVPNVKKQTTNTYRDFEESLERKKKKRKFFW